MGITLHLYIVFLKKLNIPPLWAKYTIAQVRCFKNQSRLRLIRKINLDYTGLKNFLMGITLHLYIVFLKKLNIPPLWAKYTIAQVRCFKNQSRLRLIRKINLRMLEIT